MNFLIIIYFVSLLIRIIFTVDYDYVDDDGKQVASHSILPNSQHIDHLSSSIFDSLSPSNLSLTSFLFTDETINLHDLGITSIESSTFINYQIPVTTIILSSNFLSYLPPNLFQPFISTLMNLNLQHNQFHSLSNNYFLRHLNQLHILDLSHNEITELSIQDFIGLEHLETLILRQNHLTYLSYSIFIHCRTITTLDLSDNQISRIDSNTFRSLNNLEILLLSNNPLGQRSLTINLLQPLQTLEYLDLENTQLENLPPFLFISNQRLQSIKLRENHLQTTWNNSLHSLKRTFCGVKSLIEIDLVNTHIHSLDICTYYQISSLRRLYLMNNPLHCTCDLFYLKYGDIFRVLLVDQTHANVDRYLNHWITRPELRRHLEKAHARGDFYRLPIELSLFARCATPKKWEGYEIGNITGIYSQCRQRWIVIEQECQNYCQGDEDIRSSLDGIRLNFYLIVFLVFIDLR